MTIAGSKVCVVGGAGFLGSHVVRKLQEMKCEVTVLDNFSVGKPNNLPLFIELLERDITVDSLHNAFEDTDYVLNYAAMPFIPECFDNPYDFVETNTLGALDVIESAHAAGVKRILQVSSAEVYGDSLREANKIGVFEHKTIDEGFPICPPSTYAVSKTAIDQLCLARYKERQVPVIVLRQFNCVGERETHPYVIPEIIEQVHYAKEEHGQIVINLGENTERDFLYAGDAASMAIELLEKGQPGEAYNLGSENSISIYELAEMICSIMRPGIQLMITKDLGRLRPSEIYALRSNNTKIHNVIDYRPQVSLENALRRTINYYKENDCKWSWSDARV